MANRLSLDEKLAAIRRLRAQEPSAEIEAELRRGLKDRSNLIVAAAAAIVGEQSFTGLAADLESAFERFLTNPLKDDKLCRAKIAVIQALDKLEHSEPEVFQKAARHVQLEPVWGGEADSAAPLRAAALIALARIGTARDLPLLVDAMADSEREVRIAAALALGCFGTESAALVLRLKARLGDADPEVLSECLSGLLTVDPGEYLPFVAGLLESGGPARCEAAVLALGKSRLPGAFEALKSCWLRREHPELEDEILLAIAMLRLPAAIDYLLERVASDSERHAAAALTALKIHSHDPRLRERVAGLVQQRRVRSLQERFDRDFRSDD
ncbi:MAG: HEAT repeat domain-containing protein [Isosphaeraceae bacterium]